MGKIELTVADIHAASQPSEAFSLILKEKEGRRYVPVIIGMSEARAILVELNQSPTHRPLTHELFVSLADNFACSLVEVNIVHFENGVYFADMLMMRSDSTLFHLDARPSDAIALALKSNAPFFMQDDIFEANCQEDTQEDSEYNELGNFAEDILDEEDVVSDSYIDKKLTEMTTAELQSLLEGAVESEDFELAERIQKELNRR
ncbi:MAG: bifunctional nuclease family protein [Bacteroidales bacterium]|nr:bifunctional nuclease family protein [Bacteroidales bacterium]